MTEEEIVDNKSFDFKPLIFENWDSTANPRRLDNHHGMSVGIKSRGAEKYKIIILPTLVALRSSECEL
jgi:hypothetical protein